MSELTSAIAYLRSPLAIRARCETLLEAGLAGTLSHFAVDLAALPIFINRVAAAARAKYPGVVPVPDRTDIFRAGGVDRVALLDAELTGMTPEEKARVWIDLIFVSVMLDAGATDAWRFTEPETGIVLGGTEGLAVASLHAFRAGLFSSMPNEALRVDASGLRDLHPDELARAFQVSDSNPLDMARSKRIRAFGGAVALAPRTFRYGRPGGLVDALQTSAVTAPALMQTLLEGLAPIWPDSITVGDVSMGDVGRHPAAGGAGPSAGLVPFHKLAQWLAYSLFAPLHAIGITVQQPGALTGLPDKRTGDLLAELGVLVRKSDGPHAIVESRALTVALLDRAADGIQRALGMTSAELPLSHALQILSDGTVV